ncbi:MAG: formate/nitrite transporter family protein [Nitriliruptorales bacterium]|nr:formate/nitrite transporter family protein [Nitriliruptorales bacterium]
MAVAPSPSEIFERATQEGRRRLEMPPLEQVATGFIAGVTIVFGIVALGVVEGLAKPGLGEGVAAIGGALAFGVGLVFLIVGRTELFTENFFDPVAVAIQQEQRSVWLKLGRLWGTILVLNLVGGVVLTAIMTIPGALPAGASDALVVVAEDIAAKTWMATLARAVMAGALITLLSYLLEACDTVAARIPVAYMVGVVLALGPFDHVIVSALHLLFGVFLSDKVGYLDVLSNIGVATMGNVLGGVLLITLTHTAQVRSERA